jgi:hypothetical protein
MSTLANRLHSWIRTTLRRPRLETDMEAELCFHIDAYAEDLVRQSIPRAEAMRRARVEFGGIENTKEGASIRSLFYVMSRRNCLEES